MAISIGCAGTVSPTARRRATDMRVQARTASARAAVAAFKALGGGWQDSGAERLASE
ncbi:hypothetical protein HF313_19665 [Massilia atriviolacea]|uniref:hypothetical protein n=1 Tax=Massilia atriviolacea TaxID=2495579 RepID=UPI0013E0D460|nr:hypothetical protein [Massilia atriviolacea]